MTKAPKSVAILNEDEAEIAIRKMAMLQYNIDKTEAEFNTKITQLKKAHDEKVKAVEEEIKALHKLVYLWANKNRKNILPEDSKTLTLKSGKIGWRLTPPRVSIAKKVANTIIKTLQESNLGQFIHVEVIQTVDKQAMLKEPELAKTVEGVTIKSSENFFIEPNKYTEF